MRVLITGGFGYLGGRLSNVLKEHKKYEIYLGSRLNSATLHSSSKTNIIQTQWNKPKTLDEATHNIDVIVHLAGMNAGDCAADPIAALEVNAVATANLLKAAINQRVKRFIYLSTAHVYGSPLTGDIIEESLTNATHPYATSNLAGEEVVLAAHAKEEIESVVIRLSNTFGAPTQIHANCWMLVVNDLCKQVVATNSMLLHSSGQQRRDFICLSDACRAIQHLMHIRTTSLSNQIFNVGGDWSPTILEMAQYLASRYSLITGVEPVIRFSGEAGTVESSNPLNYSIKKLKHTGFKLTGHKSIDHELDALINFCLISQ